MARALYDGTADESAPAVEAKLSERARDWKAPHRHMLGSNWVSGYDMGGEIGERGIRG